MSFKHRIPKFLTVLATLAVLSACTASDDPADVAEEIDTAMDSLVSATWLREHIDDPDLVVIDATVLIEQDGSGNLLSVNGRESYEAGHIPTAAFADLLGDLSDADNPLEFSVPSPEQFAAAMGALGVGDDSRVVLYDRMNTVWASRVWWMLRWIGFDNAALLDGGLDAWTAAGGAVSTEAVSPSARTLTVTLRPELIVDQDEVRASIGDDSVNLIDAMTEQHYRGEWAMYARPGHITGATNVPTTALFDESGKFRSEDELDVLFDSDRGTRAITYCGGGIAASADAFVMTRLGFTDVAIYAASLQEWAANPDNPMDVVLDFDESED
ncbi:MAG: sulfurtransferase [Woeseiaceae bacterium]